ncbi:D-alanyl-D-alanine carboxypeptidase [Pedococcus dokdonensis]|uniref:D-alanyl-D-alanine carboxypeptidase n=1 Tax=Pedococcus dokdonensis TaxID=443156 RepID=A0A1H0UHS6_9MICO|nr:M15 family metallopeptidase [Pedococcus dokdonensis]SDP65406.1 D-alanyl-D-alanine carboxypeptidase [Pedococcus dokdonensis]
MSSRPVYAVPLVPLVCLALAACGGDPGGSAAPTSVSATTPSSTTTAPPTTTSTTTSPTTTKPTTTSATTQAPPKPTRSTPAARPSPRPATALSPVPRAGAEPTVRFPKNEPAVGSGANASIARVPDSVWNRMVGVSWTSGCPVGRSQLRYVRVNFWGFDGKRSRGSIVVNASIADETAAAFTRLYSLQFRIRQMKPMDSTWGKNPKGPGANDYAAMEADNTSAFNCRYVGGEEASKVYSKHAYGTAIDVNDFENPYVADNGTVYPDRYFLTRRGPAPGVFSSSGSAAVRAFTSQGLRWGGLWSNPDYQHFDR